MTTTNGTTYLRVFGTPAPQGSKRHVGNGVMVESSKKLAPWRKAVYTAAISDRAATYADPVRIDATFLLRRPASHYGTGRNAWTLRPSAPLWPVSRAHGDLDKLLRSTFDGLADGLAIARDDLVVIVNAAKVYADADVLPGAIITIRKADLP